MDGWFTGRDWEHWKELYKDYPEDFPDRVPWKTFREFSPIYVNFNPEKRCVLHDSYELPSAPHCSKAWKLWFRDDVFQMARDHASGPTTAWQSV